MRTTIGEKVDVSFLVVVGVALSLVSAMIVFRMAAGGVPAPRIALYIGELWLTFVIWVAVFRTIGQAAGAAAGSGELSELRGLASRLAGVSGAARLWLLLGVGASLALAAHLMWSLSRIKYAGIRS